MHCLELARLANCVAVQGPALALLRPALTAESITPYWVASRERFELWNRGLARLVDLETSGRSLAVQDWWDEHVPMVEEILVSESLTRVMAATGAALDEGFDDLEIEPVTQSIYGTHLECRNRVLRLLLMGHGHWGHQAVNLNRLRRCAERWTDFLLAPLVAVCPRAAEFAFDRLRVQAFLADMAGTSAERSEWVWRQMTTMTLQMSLAALCQRRESLSRANSQLAQAVLGCLPSELFDSGGVPLRLSVQRIRLSRSPEQNPVAAIDENVSAARRSEAKHLLFHAPQPAPKTPHLARWTF